MIDIVAALKIKIDFNGGQNMKMKLYILTLGFVLVNHQLSLADTHDIHSSKYEIINNQSLLESEVLFENYVDEFTDLINHLQLAEETAYNLSGNSVADSCVALMNKNQIQGSIGVYISQVFSAHSAKLPHLLQGGKINSICPKYPSLSLMQKSQLWTLILATIAHFESSCNPTVPNKGPNGIAYGYYQLHKGKENTYDGNAQLCAVNASGDPKLASKCTLSMLEKQFVKENGILFSPKSYWDVLRPNGRSKKASLIRSAIMRSSICNPKYL